MNFEFIKQLSKMEVWKYATDIERVSYEVSTHGRVRSTLKSTGATRILKERLCGPDRNRAIVSLGRLNQSYIYHLVARVFIPNPDNLPYVDHIDGNPRNNHVSNLRWVNNQVNQWNSRIRNDNTSGMKGVRFLTDRNKWAARWFENGVEKKKTTFATMEEAYEYRKQMVEKHYGPEYIEDR
jgi:hypothetical protein